MEEAAALQRGQAANTAAKTAQAASTTATKAKGAQTALQEGKAVVQTEQAASTAATEAKVTKAAENLTETVTAAKKGKNVAGAGAVDEAAALQRGRTVAKAGSVGSKVVTGTKLLPQFNSVESLIQNAGKLRRLKKGVREGWITGNADDIFIRLANQYGVQIQTGAKGRFFISGNIRVDLGRSSTSNILTLYIDNNRRLFKIRIQ